MANLLTTTTMIGLALVTAMDSKTISMSGLEKMMYYEEDYHQDYYAEDDWWWQQEDDDQQWQQNEGSSIDVKEPLASSQPSTSAAPVTEDFYKGKGKSKSNVQLSLAKAMVALRHGKDSQDGRGKEKAKGMRKGKFRPRGFKDGKSSGRGYDRGKGYSNCYSTAPMDYSSHGLDVTYPEHRILITINILILMLWNSIKNIGTKLVAYSCGSNSKADAVCHLGYMAYLIIFMLEAPLLPWVHKLHPFHMWMKVWNLFTRLKLFLPFSKGQAVSHS